MRVADVMTKNTAHAQMRVNPIKIQHIIDVQEDRYKYVTIQDKIYQKNNHFHKIYMCDTTFP